MSFTNYVNTSILTHTYPYKNDHPCIVIKKKVYTVNNLQVNESLK